MNERIKELALEAKLGPALLLHHWGKIDALTDSEQEDLEKIKKFAELIVRECIEIVEYKGRKVGTKHPVGFNLMDATWDIKEHFGVEE